LGRGVAGAHPDRVSPLGRAREAARTGLREAELLERIQGEAYAGYERTVDAHVKNLRKKLAATAARLLLPASPP
jgi:hypothetical protein